MWGRENNKRKLGEKVEDWGSGYLALGNVVGGCVFLEQEMDGSRGTESGVKEPLEAVV